MAAAQDGFWAVVPKDMLLDLHVTPEDLQEMVCGQQAMHGASDDFTVEKVCKAVHQQNMRVCQAATLSVSRSAHGRNRLSSLLMYVYQLGGQMIIV